MMMNLSGVLSHSFCNYLITMWKPLRVQRNSCPGKTIQEAGCIILDVNMAGKSGLELQEVLIRS